MTLTAAADAAPPVRTRAVSIAEELGVDDVLVFASVPGGFRLIGGVGRGVGWAEIVEIRLADEELADRAWRSGVAVRTSVSDPVRVVGPYWAHHSAIVPVGNEHLVVFGGSHLPAVSDAALVGIAARIVSETHGVSAEKLLADELELVHAIRALMAYRAETVRDTARHIALVAARALSCDVAAIHVPYGVPNALEVLRLAPTDEFESNIELAGPDAAAYLMQAASLSDVVVDQSVDPDPKVWVEEVVSRLTLPIGTGDRPAALALGHAAARPRGFTLLCQRIGRALAESAELLLSQAIARERLAAEHDLLRRVSRTDALTGVGNRAAWDDAMTQLSEGDGAGQTQFAVLSVDLDDLKATNDRYGHAVGDTVIRGAANLLRASVREHDLIARVGGDEFLVLLLETDTAGAQRVVRRIGRNLRMWRVTEHGLSPELSVGWAISGQDSASAVARADERMYASKRRRFGRRDTHRQEPGRESRSRDRRKLDRPAPG